MRYSIKPLILVAFSFISIVACQPTGLQETNESSVKPTECEVVRHKLGETCVPNNPQRIVALDPIYLADYLFALGIKPIGMGIHSDVGEEKFVGLTAEDIEGIERIGDVYQPSLERIFALKPDLILAMDFAHEQIYQQLSAIAPTVLIEYEKYYLFKKNLRYLAQILNRKAEANKIISQYQARLEELREKLNRKPEEIEVAVLIYYDSRFVISYKYHTSHEIFSDIGLNNKVASGEWGHTISLEVLSQYDTDVLFIVDYEKKTQSFFLENPLIASLDAVKNNRAYFVDAHIWSTNGPLGVNKILDDLFQYLPKAMQNL